MKNFTLFVAITMSLVTVCHPALSQTIETRVTLPPGTPLEIELIQKGDLELREDLELGEDIYLSGAYDLIIRNNSSMDLVGLRFLKVANGDMVYGQHTFYFHYFSSRREHRPILAGEEGVRGFSYMAVLEAPTPESKLRSSGADPEPNPQLELKFYSAVFSDGTSLGVRQPLADECLDHHESYLPSLAVRIVDAEVGSEQYEALMDMRDKSTTLVSKIHYWNWIAMTKEAVGTPPR